MHTACSTRGGGRELRAAWRIYVERKAGVTCEGFEMWGHFHPIVRIDAGIRLLARVKLRSIPMPPSRSISLSVFFHLVLSSSLFFFSFQDFFLPFFLSLSRDFTCASKATPRGSAPHPFPSTFLFTYNKSWGAGGAPRQREEKRVHGRMCVWEREKQRE